MLSDKELRYVGKNAHWHWPGSPMVCTEQRRDLAREVLKLREVLRKVGRQIDEQHPRSAIIETIDNALATRRAGGKKR